MKKLSLELTIDQFVDNANFGHFEIIGQYQPFWPINRSGSLTCAKDVCLIVYDCRDDIQVDNWF